jgi:small subunit ribosomal protein S1
MANEVNNEAEGSKTGESSAAEQAPEQKVEEQNGAPAADAGTTGEPAPAAPRTVAKPAPAAETTPAETAAADEGQGSGDIDFGAILEQFEQEQATFQPGDLVEGKVVGVSDRGALIDFGYKSEGVIAAEELASSPETLSVGDTVEVLIKNLPGGDAPPTLSRSDARLRKVWNDIEEAYKEERPITGRIVDKTKGGLRVDIEGIEAFLPGSQIDSRPIRGLDSYIGQDIEAKIIKFSRRRNNIVLSRKVITDVEINEQKAATLANIDVGYVVEGTIKNLTEYGAFVDIGGIDGLLHVTDMSWGRLNNPADAFKVNEHLQVKVLKLDREREKISLGYKQLQPDPWSTVVEMYPVNTKVNGKVSSVTEYGIFVELEPGVEGLVHVSEISWSKRSANPKKMFNKGDVVEVQVLGVDTEEKRISLGMKQLQDNPWHNISARYPIGTKIRGKVRNLTDFGAFVEVEDGIDGLVHVSDITWAKKLKHPKDLLKKDQEVEAVVTNIDAHGQRLSLSMKDLTPSAWEGFVATHRPGDVVRGKVSRFTSFGIFVELGEGLEGLCHISELSDERVESAESVAKLGQEMDFKILRIENAEQKIGLSHRAVGKEDEPIVDTRVYSSEAKSGMASLGELANLMKGGAASEAPERETTKEEREEAKKARKEKAKQEYEASLAKEAEGGDEGGSEKRAGEEAPEAAGEAPAVEAEAEPAGESETAAEETPAAEAGEPEAEASPSSEAAEEAASQETPGTGSDESAAEAEAPSADAGTEQAEEAAAEPSTAETKAEETVASSDDDTNKEESAETSA